MLSRLLSAENLIVPSDQYVNVPLGSTGLAALAAESAAPTAGLVGDSTTQSLSKQFKHRLS
jgi:hypothetical protein